MKLFIPSINDQIKLTTDWEFPLFTEYKNRSLTEYLDPTSKSHSFYSADESIPCTLKAGTILMIKRIYIRSGKKEWDSITFGVAVMEGLPKKHRRLTFWAKLVDVNEIECERI